MEGAACEAIAEAIPEEKTTVGIELNISHLAATPVGMEVRAEAAVTAVDGNIITFSIAAYDEAGKIGEGIHKRAIVTAQRFLDKTYAKL
jgi:predicted thioesterase